MSSRFNIGGLTPHTRVVPPAFHTRKGNIVCRPIWLPSSAGREEFYPTAHQQALYGLQLVESEMGLLDKGFRMFH